MTVAHESSHSRANPRFARHFSPGGSNLYQRVLLHATVKGARELAWVYTAEATGIKRHRIVSGSNRSWRFRSKIQSKSRILVAAPSPAITASSAYTLTRAPTASNVCAEPNVPLQTSSESCAGKLGVCACWRAWPRGVLRCRWLGTYPKHGFSATFCLVVPLGTPR